MERTGSSGHWIFIQLYITATCTSNSRRILQPDTPTLSHNDTISAIELAGVFAQNHSNIFRCFALRVHPRCQGKPREYISAFCGSRDAPRRREIYSIYEWLSRE